MMIQPYVEIRDIHRTIVIGDIHGCFDEFQRLLEQVEHTEDDLIVHVGDMIDRGPQSWEVAEFFRDTPNAISALGNHERRIAGAVRGTSVPAWSQLQTLSQMDQERWSDWAAYFDSLPAVVETPHAIITHGRLDPSLPLDQQDPYFTCAVGGPSVVIERDDDGVPTWFNQLSADKPICIGHIGYDRVELVPQKLYALDTGAVKGGTLTAVVLPQHQLVSVPVDRNYYAESRHQWQTAALSPNQWIAEWSLANSLPKGEPEDWPIKKVANILLANQPIDNHVLSEAYQEVSRVYTALELDPLIGMVRSKLEDKFGIMPSRGAERGEYFQRLKGNSPTGQQGRFFTILLQCPASVSGIELLARIMPKQTLRCAVKEIRRSLKNLAI